MSREEENTRFRPQRRRPHPSVLDPPRHAEESSDDDGPEDVNFDDSLYRLAWQERRVRALEKHARATETYAFAMAAEVQHQRQVTKELQALLKVIRRNIGTWMMGMTDRAPDAPGHAIPSPRPRPRRQPCRTHEPYDADVQERDTDRLLDLLQKRHKSRKAYD